MVNKGLENANEVGGGVLSDKEKIALEMLELSGEIDHAKEMINILEFKHGFSNKPEEIRKITDARLKLTELERKHDELGSKLVQS